MNTILITENKLKIIKSEKGDFSKIVDSYKN